MSVSPVSVTNVTASLPAQVGRVVPAGRVLLPRPVVGRGDLVAGRQRVAAKEEQRMSY